MVIYLIYLRLGQVYIYPGENAGGQLCVGERPGGSISERDFQ